MLRRSAIVAVPMMGGAVIVMLVRRTIRVDVNLAALIMNADVTFDQAMRDGGVGGECKRGRRRERAKGVERGQSDRRFDSKRLGQGR